MSTADRLDTDRGVQSVSRVAMMPAMIAIAAAGFPSLATPLAPNDDRARAG